MNDQSTNLDSPIWELLGLGVIICLISLAVGIHAESFIITLIGLCIGGFFIKKSFSRPAMQADLPILVFKNNQAAFEYICHYVVFPQDMAVGIVLDAIKSNEYSKLTLKCLFNDQILIVDNSLNTLNNRVKEGDLVLCLLFAGKMVVSYLLDHKFNPNTLSWQIIFNSGDIKLNEIRVGHLQVPRPQFQRN